MDRSTYINFPCRDLDRATGFFTALGFAVDPAGGPDTRRVVLGDTSSLLLHSHAYFAEFAGAAVVDTSTAREVAVGLSAASREEVDEMIDRAVAAGGSDAGVQDLGWMYMRAFVDPDGHRWSMIYMKG